MFPIHYVKQVHLVGPIRQPPFATSVVYPRFHEDVIKLERLAGTPLFLGYNPYTDTILVQIVDRPGPGDIAAREESS